IVLPVTGRGLPFAVHASDAAYTPMLVGSSVSARLTVEPTDAVATAAVVVDGAVLVPWTALVTWSPEMTSAVVAPGTALTQFLVSVTELVVLVLVNVQVTPAAGIVNWPSGLTVIVCPPLSQASDDV